MTRDKAIEVNHILCRIENCEAVIDELEMSKSIGTIHEAYGEDQTLYEELKAIV